MMHVALSDSYVLKFYGSVLFIFKKKNVNYVLIMLDGKVSLTIFLLTFFKYLKCHLLITYVAYFLMNSRIFLPSKQTMNPD